MKKINSVIEILVTIIGFFVVFKTAGTTTTRAVICGIVGGAFVALQWYAGSLLEWIFRPLIKKWEAKIAAQRKADEEKFEAAVQAALEKKLKEEAGK